jgi:hypothetical protein
MSLFALTGPRIRERKDNQEKCPVKGIRVEPPGEILVPA